MKRVSDSEPSSVSDGNRGRALAPLQSLLARVVASNPFYGRKLAAVGCSAIPISADDFSTRFPLTTKAELVADQLAHPPYGTNLTEPREQYVRCHQTSGTTGEPMRWLDTAASWSSLTDDWVRVLRAAGMTSADRVLIAFSFGPFLGFWVAFEAAQRLGCLTLPGGGMSSSQRARVLWEHRCTVLCGTPTYLLHLADAARAEGMDFQNSPVRLLLVAGEPGGSQVHFRARLSEAWSGARVFDHHGLTEVGPVTYEHPQQAGNLVVLEESFWIEVIEPKTLIPVAAGDLGELVLTTLRRSASPVIRYRTGDLVRARRMASAGTLETAPSAVIMEGGILGRVDDMLVIRGINLYPSALDELIRGFANIGEYRVTQDRRAALPELELEIEAEGSTATALAAKLQQRLAIRIPVRSVPAGSLPRFEMKARRWRQIG